MRTSGRFAILAATVASAMSLASLTGPAPASAAPLGRDGLEPLTTVLQPVDARASEWLTIRWTTGRRVCHVRVRVHGSRHMDVAYPGDRRYTSFSKGDGLRPGRIDYTSFRVTAHEGDPGWVFLTATVDYDYCRRGSPAMNDAIGFWVPVRGAKFGYPAATPAGEAAATRLPAPRSRG